MAEVFEAQPPKYKGDGISIWDAKDKNGNDFFRVKVLNGPSVAVFP